MWDAKARSQPPFGTGWGQCIRFYDRDVRKSHRTRAVQAVIEWVLFDDEMRAREGAMTSSYIDDEIALADFDSAQYLLTSHVPFPRAR
jgi:hypothetical protein